MNAILINVENNDVTVKRKFPTNTADSIITVGRKCEDASVNGVIAFSTLHRKISRFQMKINEVNSVLKNLYEINGFTFTDNANINNSDISLFLIGILFMAEQPVQGLELHKK